MLINLIERNDDQICGICDNSTIFNCNELLVRMAEASARRPLPIPKRLEAELSNIPKFKPRVEPARRTVADILGESVERAAYDEILGPLINKRPSSLSKVAGDVYSGRQPGRHLSDSSSVPTSEKDFTTSLLTRLADAEAETKSMRKQLVEKITKLSAVERENVELRAVVDAPSHLIDELNFYKSENFHLEKQIVDMEEFLHDYGLQWVGNSTSRNSDRSEKKDGTEDSILQGSGGSSGGVSYHLFSKKIQELNSMLSSEPTQIVTDTEMKRARLVHASELFKNIRVTFYRDGIMIRRGPFRANTTPSYESFIRDIMDGFFPSEFREEFPDGVMFHLIDRHSDEYFGSKDQSQCDDVLSKEQLLNKIPKTIVKNGNIVSVRQDISDFIDGKNNADINALKDNKLKVDNIHDVSATPTITDITSKAQSKIASKSGYIILNTAASQVIELGDGTTSNGRERSVSPIRRKNDEKLDEKPSHVTDTETRIGSGSGTGMESGPKSGTGLEIELETASVQIRWFDGTVLVAIMFENETIGNIRKEIEKHMKSIPENTDSSIGSGSKSETGSGTELIRSICDFELRSAYPPRVLVDSMTLLEAGLIPNGTIHARKLLKN